MGTNGGISALVKGEERVVSGKERRKAERKGCVWERQLGVPREHIRWGGGERPALSASVRWP